LLVIISLIYGYYRLHTVAQEKQLAHIKVGLISVSRSPDKIVNPKMAAEIFSAYQPLMKSAVAQGAEVILLPEESFTVTTDSATIYKKKLAHFANQYNVKLIIGVRDHKQAGSYNSAWVFDEQGHWLGEYHKRHFVPVVESGLMPGVDLLTFQIKENKSGIAICRDMDYQKPASDYGSLGSQILFVPAWDFDVDAKVHAFGAWMRGVEYGYTLVRSARDGFLSVSAPTGQIISKVPAIDSRGTILIATAPIYQNQSYFAAHPFWFVILLWLLLGALLLA
jgi:apolipoprotein N-acyltransferase